MQSAAVNDAFFETGSQHFPSALTAKEMNLLQSLGDDGRVIGPGLRLTDNDDLRQMLGHDSTLDLIASSKLGETARAVRAVFFDKSAKTNWALGWHQDRTIVVRERRDVPGFGPWSNKSGLIHVEPPYDLISRMVTLRAHFDEVDADNAPLLVAPGSHRAGRIPIDRIDETVAEFGSLSCLAKSGDVWAYSTAIVHASEAAHRPRRRRVLQIDYCAEELPGGLEWLGV